jgi:serine/threonine-protein kinase
MTLPDPALWKRVSPLADELLDLPAAERADRLRALRDEDPRLADELHKLLAAADRAVGEGFLAGLAGLSPMAPPMAAPSLAGLRLGAYTLVSPLGQGGTGSVWRARRDDGRFEGEVAIKLLHLSLIGQAGAQRFRREGAILGRLAHPNIARLFDAGIADFGQPYLVLELVDGERIDRHCDERRMTIEQRLRLFGDVLSAVTHAHSHLVIHRDIKPSNILVDREGRVKLLDFGIAKLVEDETQGAEATELTREGGRPLTPEFAAPEQLMGDAVTTATDVYALGVLLYQLITGRHPTVPAGATTAQAMRATLDTEPPVLSSAWKAADGEAALADAAAQRASAPGPLLRQIGGDLEQIVARALRKRPQDRYASADAFADDLRRYLAHEPVSARPHSLTYRMAMFLRRHRRMVAAAALTGLAIIGGLIGTITQANRAQQQAQQAQKERDNALRDLQFADAARDLLGFLLSQGDGKPMTAAELLVRAQQLAEQQFAGDPLTRGRLQLMIGIEHGNAREFEKSKAVLDRALASAREAGSASLQSNVECMLASTLGDQSEPQRAIALFGQAIARLQAPARSDPGVLAACLHMRADLNAQLGQPQAMLADAQAALALLGTPRADQRVAANSLRIVIAEAYGRLGETARAIAGYESSLADMESMGRQHTARSVIRYNNFSRMLYLAGQPQRAQQMAARGLQISRAIAENRQLDAVIESNQARALIELGRHAEAKSLIEHALGLAAEGKDVRLAGRIAMYGAPAWCESADLGRCESLLEMARRNFEATLPPGHVSFAELEMASAQLSIAQQQPTTARDRLLRAVGAFDAAKESSPLRIRALALLARTEAQLGEMQEADRHAVRAVQLAREAAKDFPHSLWLGEALLAQAAVLQSGGDKARAQASLGEAAVQLGGALGEQAPALRQVRAQLARR